MSRRGFLGRLAALTALKPVTVSKATVTLKAAPAVEITLPRPEPGSIVTIVSDGKRWFTVAGTHNPFVKEQQ